MEGGSILQKKSELTEGILIDKESMNDKVISGLQGKETCGLT